MAVWMRPRLQYSGINRAISSTRMGLHFEIPSTELSIASLLGEDFHFPMKPVRLSDFQRPETQQLYHQRPGQSLAYWEAGEGKAADFHPVVS